VRVPNSINVKHCAGHDGVDELFDRAAKDRAFEWLDKAYQSRMYWLRQDPRLDSIHSDRRFQELLTKMKFPQ